MPQLSPSSSQELQRKFSKHLAKPKKTAETLYFYEKYVEELFTVTFTIKKQPLSQKDVKSNKILQRIRVKHLFYIFLCSCIL